MLDVSAVERVLDKRASRGASDASLIAWLDHLKATSWRKQTKIIDGFISAIKQTKGGDNAKQYTIPKHPAVCET